MTKKQTMRFVAACYGGVLAVVLLMNLFHFAADSIGRMTGGITTQQYDFSTMQTQEIDVTSPTQGKATGGDPQLLLENFAGKIIELRFEIAYSKHPGEVNLYYKKAGEEYADTKKIWGKAKSDGTYVFVLPRTKIDAVRIDPTNIPGIEMTLKSFTVNAPRSFFSYFAFTYEGIFDYIVYTGLAAAFAGYFISEYGTLVRRKFVKKEG